MGIRRGKGYRLLIAPIANHWASVHEQDPFFSPHWEPGKGCVWRRRDPPRMVQLKRADMESPALPPGFWERLKEMCDGR